MTLELLAFGIAKDIVNGKKIGLDVPDGLSISGLKMELCRRFPGFERLKTFAIAVNSEYRHDDFSLSENDEIVIIPPVSGG